MHRSAPSALLRFHEPPSVRRHDRLHERRPRVRHRPQPRRDHLGRRPGDLGQRRLRLPRRSVPGHRPPEPLAAGPALCAAGAVRGHRGHLPGAWTRSVEHDRRRGRARDHRHRPTDLGRDRRRRARALPGPPRRPARHGADLHPLPRRPLRRRARGAAARDGGRRSGARPRRLPGARGQRERLRGQRHDAAGHVHVRRPARQGPRRTDRRRARHDHLHRHDDADPADRGHHAHGPGGGTRRRTDRLPAHPGHRGAGRDELPLPGPPRALPGRERDAQHAQHRDPARGRRPRRADLVALSRRGRRPVRRRDGRRLRVTPLAHLGPGGSTGGWGTARRTGPGATSI